METAASKLSLFLPRWVDKLLEQAASNLGLHRLQLACYPCLCTAALHLPHDNTKAPNITGWGELSFHQALWCHPSNWKGYCYLGHIYPIILRQFSQKVKIANFADFIFTHHNIACCQVLSVFVKPCMPAHIDGVVRLTLCTSPFSDMQCIPVTTSSMQLLYQIFSWFLIFLQYRVNITFIDLLQHNDYVNTHCQKMFQITIRQKFKYNPGFFCV